MSTIQLGFDHDYSMEALRTEHQNLYKKQTTEKSGNFTWEKTWATTNSVYGHHDVFRANSGVNRGASGTTRDVGQHPGHETAGSSRTPYASGSANGSTTVRNGTGHGNTMSPPGSATSRSETGSAVDSSKTPADAHVIEPFNHVPRVMNYTQLKPWRYTALRDNARK